MTRSTTCAACAQATMEPFLAVKRTPVHQNLLMSTRREAEECDRGDVILGYCSACGFIANLVFDPSLLCYSQKYENTQCFSPIFRSYLESIAEHLISTYQITDKDVIEIGCGKGDFLKLLCDRGRNRGVGFDPSYVDDVKPAGTNVTFVKDFYSERYVQYAGDLLCCRHVLEHVPDPAAFVSSIRRSIGDRTDTVVFFEVPSVLWILRNLTFWDIFYEHCCYFEPGSLARLFASCGFECFAVSEQFGGQYLWLEARPALQPLSPNVPALVSSSAVVDSVGYFVAQYEQKMAKLRDEVTTVVRQGRRAAFWGAGAKGVTILNTLNLSTEVIPYVVDINPRKQGKYIPGTGQQIVSPGFLCEYVPDVLFGMNPMYEEEIRGQMAQLGVNAKLIIV